MKTLLFNLGASDHLVDRLRSQHGFAPGELERRRFPDGETYLRFLTPVEGRPVAFLCSLDRPDEKSIALLLAADAARRQGCRSVGLIAPYLAYMRQDLAFHKGEAVTSLGYAALLSRAFDWLVTVDPHLHRHPSLASIYSLDATAVSAAQPISEWLRAHVRDAVLIGPDEESAQWVERIAALAGVPATVFRKHRSGDYEVEISAPDLRQIGDGTPVIIDDIASSGTTLVKAVEILVQAGHAPPICLVVHPIFAGDAYDKLQRAGAAAIVSTNAVVHPTNAIDLASVIGPVAQSAIARSKS